MLPNSYADAVDIIDYTPLDRGFPTWIFIDTSQVDLPLGTKTVSIWKDSAASTRRLGHENLTFFDDHVEVIGEEYEEYVRHNTWPENVFVNRKSPLLSDIGRLEYSVERNNWIVNTYDYTDALEDAVYYDTLHSHSMRAMPPIAIVTTEYRTAGPHLWSQEDTNTFDTPEDGADIIAAVGDSHLRPNEDIDLPAWIRFSPGHRFHDERTRIINISSNSERWRALPNQRHTHLESGIPEVPVIPYFRRGWWPAGTYRLAELYYIEEAAPEDLRTAWERPAVIPIFNDEPSKEMSEEYQAQLSSESGQLVAEQYYKRCTLSDLHGDGSGELFKTLENGKPPTWVYYGRYETSAIANIAKTEGVLAFNCDPYGPGNWQCQEPVEFSFRHRDLDIVMYRFRRWPHFVWSTQWKTNEDGQKVPVYGPDAFGSTCPREDNSSFENPVSIEGEFAYQKWIRPTWDPAAATTVASSIMSVGITGGRCTSRPHSSRSNYHIHDWTEQSQSYKATYFRRESFPPGVWRRADRFTDAINRHSRVIRMHPLFQDDEPGAADAPAPWYSSVLAEWIADIEQKTGRTISNDPSGNAPWLKAWSPADNEEYGNGSVSMNVSGHRLILPIGELPTIRGQGRGSNYYGDNRDYYFARRYRSGVALTFNPCGVRYEEQRENDDRPHPLKVILDKIQEFYIDYRDPDVVEDLVDDMFERVQTKVDSYNETISRKRVRIRELQRSMSQSASDISDLLQQRSRYDSMTKPRFRHTLETHRALVTNLGKLRLEGSLLILDMNVFEIQEQPIGPLRVEIDMSSDAFPMSVSSSENLSQYNHPHPHVDVEGRVCWGTGVRLAEQMARGADPLEFLFWAATALREGYQPEDAYCKIDQWLSAPVWWCEYCEVDHPDGSDCPNQCPECDSHADMDLHNTCTEHGCWDEDDYDECPGCEADREQAEAVEQAREEEAERLREEAEAEALREEEERLREEEEANAEADEANAEDDEIISILDSGEAAPQSQPVPSDEESAAE